MEKETYKKYLEYAKLCYKACKLNHQIVEGLKEQYGEEEIEEYLESSNILQDAEVNGNVASYNIFVKNIEETLERNKIQKECEDRI